MSAGPLRRWTGTDARLAYPLHDGAGPGVSRVPLARDRGRRRGWTTACSSNRPDISLLFTVGWRGGPAAVHLQTSMLHGPKVRRIHEEWRGRKK